jgi:predicted Zn-dependent peptidase
VVLLVRRAEGESAATLARAGDEPHDHNGLRHLIQRMRLMQTKSLARNVVEADELFQNAGEKRR